MKLVSQPTPLFLSAVALVSAIAEDGRAGPLQPIDLPRASETLVHTDFEEEPTSVQIDQHERREGAGREGTAAITAAVEEKEKTRGFRVPFANRKGQRLELTFWARSDKGVRCAVWVYEEGLDRRRVMTVDGVSEEWTRLTATATPRTDGPGHFRIFFPSSYGSPPGRAWADDLTLRHVKNTAQRDHPAMALDQKGRPWLAYVAFDGEADTLRLARKDEESLRPVGRLAGPGVIHRPGLARDGEGTLWAVWSERQAPGWGLYARPIDGGEIGSERVTVAPADGSHVFADVAAGPGGRVWVVWQAFEGGPSRLYARYYDPSEGTWSDRMPITAHDDGGSWQPEIAFGDGPAAWVAFDQATDGEFDVKVAVVRPGGSVEIRPVATTPAYEAAASIAATPEGDAFYVSYERGNERWGRDGRNGPLVALNTDKHLETARVDAASGEVERLPDAKPLVAEHAGVPKNVRSLSPNLPRIAVDGEGNPWMACRYATQRSGDSYKVWRIVLLRYDRQKGRWSKPVAVANSSLSQDRRPELVRDGDGRLWMAWPSDRRTSTKPGIANVYLGRFGPDRSVDYPAERPTFPDPERGARKDPAKDTPPRGRGDRDVFTFDGETYRLYWGDFHRHTALSPDGTLYDGSVVEQFRYAYEVGKLDFLGTSDHTDIGPGHYTVYEWWRTQKLADVFHNRGHFSAFYAYEREQRWPWGHRNVVFANRGGPIVYIQRETYRQSRWAEKYPVGEGDAEIRPQELWKVLEQHGEPVTVISHTLADKRMGTNWELYDRVNHAVENLVEIYQGKRVSYEAMDAPQPRVALSPGENGERLNARKPKGVYQNALEQGLRLGIFASSDHFSTHVSFGGVYATGRDRESLIDGLNARRTIGATDKIFLRYTCNGRLLGSAFETEKAPTFEIHAEGTAPIDRIALLRNEEVHKRFEPEGDRKRMSVTFKDSDAAQGTNRYYIRLVQTDGNMAWASPVWVTYEP